jgi:hypothetical protein
MKRLNDSLKIQIKKSRQSLQTKNKNGNQRIWECVNTLKRVKLVDTNFLYATFWDII